MNMTTNPNQRNELAMLELEGSFSNTCWNLDRLGDGSIAANQAGMGDGLPCLFTIGSPFIPISSPPPTHIPYAAGYPFPSMAPSSGAPPGRFTFSSTPSSLDYSRNVPECSPFGGSISSPSAGFSTQLNWAPKMQTTFNSPEKPANDFLSKSLTGMFGCKRKSDSPPLQPFKQHITEERMAEHMSRLHISSQTPTCDAESQPIRERRLYMCEEMQRLQVESVIPAQILEKVNRPCTALVPWRPPMVPALSKENNNNEEEPDNNVDKSEMEMDS